MPLANFEVIDRLSTDEFVTIRDLGPWDHYQTVTNAAEEVVDTLAKDGLLNDGRRIFYFDSENNLDQIVHESGRFVGFAPIGIYWRDEIMKLDNC